MILALALAQALPPLTLPPHFEGRPAKTLSLVYRGNCQGQLLEVSLSVDDRQVSTFERVELGMNALSGVQLANANKILKDVQGQLAMFATCGDSGVELDFSEIEGAFDRRKRVAIYWNGKNVYRM